MEPGFFLSSCFLLFLFVVGGIYGRCFTKSDKGVEILERKLDFGAWIENGESHIN